METKMAELSEACRKHLAARWDDGGSMLGDVRFDQSKIAGGSPDHDPDHEAMAVIDLEVEDMLDFPELRGYTAVAISQDGDVAYLTKEEADDGDED